MTKAAPRLLSLSLLLLAAVSTISTGSFVYNPYEVTCNTATPTCTCPTEHKLVHVDACIFTLNVQTLQSFTRYELPSQLGGLTGYGTMWYINDTTGNMEPYPNYQEVCRMPLNDSTCTSPSTMDGYTYRSFLAINGQFPGPTLIVNYNQTVVVNFVNWLDQESVSVHWHGLTQKGTNWMDGVGGLTQCHIQPGNSFTYIFQATPAGTHWYHSHTGTQRADGLFGALIVKEKTETLANVQNIINTKFIDTPDKHTLTILDLQKTPTIEVYSRAFARTIPSNIFNFTLPNPTDKLTTVIPLSPLDFGGSPIPFWSGLINGKGRHPSVDYIKTRLSIFTISPSNVYRFRIIGSQISFTFILSIDNHPLTVIATDGAFIQPITVDYLIIQSGERYDILVQGMNSTELSKLGRHDFMIWANTLEQDPSDINRFRTDHTAEAILHYDISPEPNSTQYSQIAAASVNEFCTSKDCTVLNCPFEAFPSSYNITCIYIHQLSLLQPITNTAELPDIVPDKRIFLNFAFEGYGGTSTVNARNFRLPSRPLSLLNSSELEEVKKKDFCQDLNNPTTCDNNLEGVNLYSSSCLCTHAIPVSYGETIQLVFTAVGPNPDKIFQFGSSHPIHLHGHQFQVVDMQFGDYNDTTGQLVSGNTDIYCGGAELCTVPQWESGKNFSLGKTGKISNTAPLKDTVIVPAGGYVVVYIRADNPGHWMLHCHVDPHLVEGMSFVLSEAIDHLSSPPDGMTQCQDFSWTLDDYYNKVYGHKTAVNSDDSGKICLSKVVILATSIAGGSVLLIFLLLLIITCTVCCCYVCKYYRTVDYRPLVSFPG